MLQCNKYPIDKKEMTMSQFITHILERLAEMFPEENYQTRLEQYIISRDPKSAADIEQFEREFTYKSKRMF